MSLSAHLFRHNRLMCSMSRAGEPVTLTIHPRRWWYALSLRRAWMREWVGCLA